MQQLKVAQTMTDRGNRGGAIEFLQELLKKGELADGETLLAKVLLINYLLAPIEQGTMTLEEKDTLYAKVYEMFLEVQRKTAGYSDQNEEMEKVRLGLSLASVTIANWNRFSGEMILVVVRQHHMKYGEKPLRV